MTTSIVERLRAPHVTTLGNDRNCKEAADIIEQQANELTELRLQALSDSGKIIEAAKEVAELKVLAKKMADALTHIQDRNFSHLRTPFLLDEHKEALSAYRELIKE